MDGSSRTYGGGIYANTGCDPVLDTVYITEQEMYGTSWCYGAGLYLNASNATLNEVYIERNLLTNTSRAYGGGIYCTSSPTGQFNNVYIRENVLVSSSWCYGAGIYFNDSSPTLVNVLISDNEMGGTASSYSGGGIICRSNANPTLTNVTVSGNYRVGNGNINGTGIYIDNSTVIAKNTIFWNNNAGPEVDLNAGTLTATYSDVRGSWPGLGNIDQLPQFVGGGDILF